MNEEGKDADVNFTIADFSGKKDFAQSMDEPDFDWSALFTLFCRDSWTGILPNFFI